MAMWKKKKKTKTLKAEKMMSSIILNIFKLFDVSIRKF